jgi:hypothetical protein
MMTPRFARRDSSRILSWRLPVIGVAILVTSLLFLASIPSTSQAATAPSASQCVTCHTDAAKLKALTPPDPPAAEEAGEG